MRPPSPFSLPNIRHFLAFRAFFNARFYYPVFTVLFLDFGLTLEQFALLNTVWACTVVLSEVPSGALADFWGRRRLLLIAALLMVVAMLLLVFAPTREMRETGGALVFWLFLTSRILAGLAEAMMSGTDEALAYDTLVAEGLEKSWPHVLDWKMRFQSLAFIFAMTVGAAVYDHTVLNRFLGALGFTVQLSHACTMRLPLLCTLAFALLSLWAALGMREPEREKEHTHHSRHPLAVLALLMGRTLHAGRWILHTPFALAVILFAMCFDHTLRMLATLTSPYYRLVGLPDASFGLIGSAIAVLGLAVPRLARLMVERLAPGVNVLVLAVAMLCCLGLLPRFLPFWGALPMMGVFIGMMLCSFFSSHYLNQITHSARRATVLSFKGMAEGLALGWIGLAFAALARHERLTLAALQPGLTEEALTNAAFRATMGVFPWYLGLLLLSITLALSPWRRELRAMR